jgi:hypothetical protein
MNQAFNLLRDQARAPISACPIWPRPSSTARAPHPPGPGQVRAAVAWLRAGTQIADGYHRVCASYHLNEDTEIPCRIADIPAAAGVMPPSRRDGQAGNGPQVRRPEAGQLAGVLCSRGRARPAWRGSVVASPVRRMSRPRSSSVALAGQDSGEASQQGNSRIGNRCRPSRSRSSVGRAAVCLALRPVTRSFTVDPIVYSPPMRIVRSVMYRGSGQPGGSNGTAC